MTVPFLLCVLVAASGLHFGARAMALRHSLFLTAVSVLAHVAVSGSAAWLGALLDPTPAGGLWLAAAGASLIGFAAGALRHRQSAVATAEATQQTPSSAT